MNLANIISFYRIVITPLVVLLLLLDWPASRMWVASLTATAWLSDMVDGYVAHRCGSDSSVGPWLDWMADKVYVMSVFIALVAVGQIPAWVTVVIVAREVVIMHIRNYCASEGIVVSADNLGRLKLGVSMLAIIAVSAGVPRSEWLVYLALVLTVASGARYLMSAAEDLSASSSGERHRRDDR